MPVWWTKRSLPGSSGVMKPKPLSSLNHLTVPVAMSGGPSWDIGAAITEGAQKATTRNAGTTCVGVVPDCGRRKDTVRRGRGAVRREVGPGRVRGLRRGWRRRPRDRSGLGGLRIRPDDDRVGDRDDLVDREVGARGVLADGLGARGLVDADGADRPAALVEDVGPDPADVVGHLDVADLGRPPGGLLEVRAGAPAAAAQDRVELHVVLPPWIACEYAVDTTPRAPRAHRTDSLSFDDPEAGRRGAGLAARAHVELAKDRRDVVADRLLRYEEAPGDVGVAPPLRDEAEHLDLARCEPGRVRARRAVRPAADVAQAALAQRPGDAARGRAGAEALERVERPALGVRVGGVREGEGGLVRAAKRRPARGGRLGVAGELEPERVRGGDEARGTVAAGARTAPPHGQLPSGAGVAVGARESHGGVGLG